MVEQELLSWGYGRCSMSQRVTFTLAYLLVYILQASRSNAITNKPKRCEVRLRIVPGWICGRIFYDQNRTRYASFRGVPYAQPPVGRKRFQELKVLNAWDQGFILDATQNAPACPQTDQIFKRLALQLNGMSEDCIYLNLHVPYKHLPRSTSLHPGRGLPILVFIHGGAFQSGAGLTDILGPQYLMSKNIVVITFNYRLNVFGFYSLNSKEIPGNQGLRDMVTCLRWVQQNAHYFGGDPLDVTLMGHGAGATAAHILSLSKSTKGLFKRIVLMSGTAMPSYFTTSSKYAAEVSTLFLRLLGINHTDPVLIHEQLLQMPLLKIMHANTALQINAGIVSFNPVVDSEFPGITQILHKDPMTLISEGWGHEYPTLISYTENEAASLRWYIVEKNLLLNVKVDNIALVSPRQIYSLPEHDVFRYGEQIDEIYFKSNYTLNRLTRYLTDMMFKHPALKVAEWRAAQGGAPTYMYQLAYDFAFSPVKAAHWVDYRGSAHMDDLACVFRFNSIMSLESFNTPKNTDDEMRRWMLLLITSFMKCSKPICEGELWPPMAKNSLRYNLITSPKSVRMSQMTRREQRMVKFFDSIDPESRSINSALDLITHASDDSLND